MPAGELRRAATAPTARARPLSAPAPISSRRRLGARPANLFSLRSIRFRDTQATSAPSSAFRFVNTFMSAGVPAACRAETDPAVMAAVVD